MRFLITRPLEQSQSLKKKLELLGHVVFCFPLIEIVFSKINLPDLKVYDFLLLTSQNAVRALAPSLRKIPSSLKVVVIGTKTAEAAKKMGWRVFSNLSSLLKSENLSGQKIFYPRSSSGREESVQELTKRGAIVDCVDAYQTSPSKGNVLPLRQILKEGIDAILFFSPSAVKNFKEDIETLFIPFGSTTAQALEEKGLKPAFIPSEQNEDVFVKELEEFFKSA